ncbi:ATP-binding protein [Xanthobacter autotrophicus]|uniref:ATP-binding protein n=1 Tax=Xanthobacter autotrophicus TaxID=280 RepID=UPI0024A62114|nr:ATP-binding protein [Xanthobacter autotrophicus]MDI4658603.1 HAMP domain-containing protein [Xanthobacter autotrophicus]
MIRALIRASDSLAVRTAVVAVLGIVVVHVLSLWTYEHAMERERHAAHAIRLADQIVALRRSLAAAPPESREDVAHELSGGAIDAHWSREAMAASGPHAPQGWQRLADDVRTLAPDLGPQDVLVGAGTDPHLSLVAVRLPDGSWLNARLFASVPQAAGAHGSVLSTTLMASGVLLLSLAIAAWLTRPLRAMARTVAALPPDAPLVQLKETGPTEVRELAHAFNGMQACIAELMERRTQALAAVSHDLRTPMTRLRFRMEDVGDPVLREAMAADVAEMEQMVDATLSYLRGEASEEPVRPLDLVALVETLVDNARDRGLAADLSAPPRLVVAGRLVSLKRMVSNLVENALLYGGAAHVVLAEEGAEAVLTVRDEGPGIPQDQLAAVLEPFVRLESSRSRSTGGVGLGLSIARAVAAAHGGTLTLANGAGGGLVATVRLPKVQPETN